VGAALSCAAIVVGFGLKAILFIIALALPPYAVAVVLAYIMPAARRWALLAIPLYCVLDIAIRAQRIVRPEDIGNAFWPVLLLIIVAPAAAFVAGIGVLLWDAKGRAGLTAWAVVATVASVVAYRKVFLADARPTVQWALNLRELPASTANAACVDTGFQETDVYCYLEVDPKAFDQLLGGHAYRQGQDSGRTHTNGHRVGPDFETAVKYYFSWETPDPGFKHNHSATIRADAGRHRVLINRAGW
jgi:hypothetical protein